MMTRLGIITFLLLTLMGADQTGKNAAIVKMVRGKAFLEAKGVKAPIKKGMWLREGSVVRTEARSFVRLSFVDKSTMNVGPKSQMKIEKFSGEEASVINVLSGKIRSEVSKNYLKIDKEKSKMFVKSKSAVMGIRGTDFVFSTHAKTGATTAVLFEGSVVFNKLGKNDRGKDLESIVNGGRRINPGQFSVARMEMVRPTVPAKLSSNQFKALKKNKSFTSSEGAGKTVKKKRSVVPPGLSGAAVASEERGIQEGLSKVAKIKVERRPGSAVAFEETKGFIKGNDIKPVDGSIVHIDSGTVIPLGVDSKFDGNSQEWVSTTFEVDKNGQIIPPEGYKITEDGKLLKVDGGSVKQIDIEIKPLDMTRPLDEMPATEAIEGPRPAGEAATSNESLKRPPTMQGELTPIGTRDNFSAPVGGGNLPSTPVRVNVQKDSTGI